MGFLFILVLIFIFVSELASSKAKEIEKGKTEIVEDVSQWCPPHKWTYIEVKDKEGNFLRHKLTCELCGPLKPMD